MLSDEFGEAVRYSLRAESAGEYLVNFLEFALFGLSIFFACLVGWIYS